MKMLNEPQKKRFWIRWRDAITGLFIRRTDALGHPSTTVGESVPVRPAIQEPVVRKPRKPRAKKVV